MSKRVLLAAVFLALLLWRSGLPKWIGLVYSAAYVIGFLALFGIAARQGDLGPAPPGAHLPPHLRQRAFGVGGPYTLTLRTFPPPANPTFSVQGMSRALPGSSEARQTYEAVQDGFADPPKAPLTVAA